MTLDAAIDKLVADGYPKQQNEFLNGLGSSPLGFRIAGTEAERQAAQHVADELDSMGVSDVSLEKVPVDAWDFKGASVTVDGREMTASSFAGANGTPPEGITGDVVYVHAGSKTDFDKAGDVKGKIVLLDTYFEQYWINLQCAEATFRGAAAVIATYGPTSAPWYGQTREALGSNDAEYERSFVPAVYVSRADGDVLKAQLEKGRVAATVKNDVTITMAENGGAAYNVVGEIPGTSGDGTMVVIGGHTDAHFRAGADDTGAVSATLTMAKAMMMSGYQPKRTIVFFFDTAEEYGYTDCYFDWIIGAWYAITHEHPDWPGKAVAYINLESMAEKGSTLGVAAPPELAGWVKQVSGASDSGLARTPRVGDRISSWSNGWTFTAAGVPSITMSATGKDYWRRYHSDQEVDANIDWNMIGDIAKFTAELQAGLDAWVPPYSLAAGAASITQRIDSRTLVGAGADPAKVKRLAAAAKAYQAATKAADERLSSAGAAQGAATAGELLGIERDLNRGTLALSIWEKQILPFEQVAKDAGSLRAAIAYLDKGDGDSALRALVGVSNTWNAVFADEQVVVQDNARWAPDYPKLTWGAQSHLPPVLDVWPQWELVEAGKLSRAAGQLQAAYDGEKAELDRRLDDLSALLEGLTPRVAALAT
jgi:Iap family predicted aminopeptidase